LRAHVFLPLPALLRQRQLLLPDILFYQITSREHRQKVVITAILNLDMKQQINLHLHLQNPPVRLYSGQAFRGLKKSFQ
jgi:hypothetical protein